MSTAAEAIYSATERMAAAITAGLAGSEVKGWPVPKLSATSYLEGYIRAVSLMDELTTKVPNKELRLDSVLLFRSNKQPGGMMLRVVAIRAGERLVCFKFGKDPLNLLNMFARSMSKDTVEWRLDTLRAADDPDEGSEGFLDPLV